jgi:hypothetical protein
MRDVSFGLRVELEVERLPTPEEFFGLANEVAGEVHRFLRERGFASAEVSPYFRVDDDHGYCEAES